MLPRRIKEYELQDIKSWSLNKEFHLKTAAIQTYKELSTLFYQMKISTNNLIKSLSTQLSYLYSYFAKLVIDEIEDFITSSEDTQSITNLIIKPKNQKVELAF